MENPRRKSDSYHHGDLRNTMIRESISIIESEGIEGLTLRKAARNAGVSHNAPAHHFGDLKGLLAAIAEEGFVMMTAWMERAAERAPGHPLERFRAIGLAYVDFACHHIAFFRVMYHPVIAGKTAYPGLRDASSKALGLLTGFVKECQDAALIVRGDPKELALFAWSTAHGLSTLHLDGQIDDKGLTDESIMEYAGKVMDLVYLGLRPDAMGIGEPPL